MRDQQPRRHRLAATLVLVGLALAAVGIGYNIYAGRPRSLPPLTSAPQPAPIEQAKALLAMLTYSFLIFLAFLLGSYLILRLGRRLVGRPTPRRPSRYVDVWSSYRLTKEQIDTAIARLTGESPSEGEGSDDAPPKE